MKGQTTFRLPPALARALARRAREQGVPKSHVVREALEQYLALPPVPDVALIRERSAPYLGALQLNEKDLASDPVARLIRDRNWRP